MHQKSPARIGVYAKPSTLWWAPDPAGSILGMVMAALSVTPSLLPRPAVLQGVLAGLGFAIGYLIGVIVWSVIRRLLRERVSRRSLPGRWWIFYLGMWVLAVVVLTDLAVIWQNEVRSLVSMSPLDGSDLVSFLLSLLLVSGLLLLVGKGVRVMYTQFRRRASGLIAALASTGIVVTVLVGLVFGAVAAVDRIYFDRNAYPEPGIAQTSSTLRSGGKASNIEWGTLGRHGAAFVNGGPTAETIQALTDQTSIEPIRVYAGIESAPTVEARAALIVDELERTRAFDRDYLVIATTTGSGWLEPQTIDAFEYLHGGNTAIAAIQYAYTPSWVSFVFDPDAPVAAARALFSAVEAKWKQLPEAERPKLVTYGLSLGAHGSQAVFVDLEDVRSRTDGALFVGSPNGSLLWHTLQAQRDAGSPAWQPILEEGRAVRWMSRADDERMLPDQWDEPRVLYLQHDTDPVTWLSPELLWRTPEWLVADQRGPNISSSMRWIPVITGLQVVVDMLMGEAVPASYGHNYGDVVLTAWQLVTPDSGLDTAAMDRIQAEIESYSPIPRVE